MRITLVNLNQLSPEQIQPFNHYPPLGLLAMGAALMDAGHHVCLAELSHWKGIETLVASLPELILIGNSSTQVQFQELRLIQQLHTACEKVPLIYGGVYPCYQAHQLVTDNPSIRVVLREPSAAVIAELVSVLDQQGPLEQIPGVVFQRYGVTYSIRSAGQYTQPQRIGWELVEQDKPRSEQRMQHFWQRCQQVLQTQESLHTQPLLNA